MVINFSKISKFLLYLVPFAAVIVYAGSLFPFIVGKYVFFRTVIDLALIFFVFGWAAGEVKIPSFKKWFSNPLALFIFLFTLIYVVAGLSGYDPGSSFWSNFERGEGGLQMLHLFIYFALLGFLFTDDKSWLRIFIISIWSAVLVALYGIAAAMGIGDFIGASLCERFAGSLGNSAYTGTFMFFAAFYAFYMANEKKWKGTALWLWAPLAVVFSGFLFLSQTRGALLGFGTAIILGLVYFFFSLPKSKVKNIILITIVVLVAGGLLAIRYRKSIDLMPFCGGGNRIIDISFSTQNYQTRLLLWKEAITAWKERPILGWGAENFTPAFEKYYNTKHFDPAQRQNPETRYSQVWFDRAHSIYFDYLVFGGALGLLSFLGIFAAYFWKFFKFNKENPVENHKTGKVNYQALIRKTLIFAIPVAYMVQGMVLFDVLPIYLNIFLVLAFANWKLGQQPTANSQQPTSRR
ncbi:O-antigen ligase family protein [Candidatus Wolfebacteria bacterium]|nr:O-antigen ligase family protein [Candidatus Wolfebacteria bacterium]